MEIGLTSFNIAELKSQCVKSSKRVIIAADRIHERKSSLYSELPEHHHRLLRKVKIGPIVFVVWCGNLFRLRRRRRFHRLRFHRRRGWIVVDDYGSWRRHRRSEVIVEVPRTMKMFVIAGVNRLVHAAHCRWNLVIRRQAGRRLSPEYVRLDRHRLNRSARGIDNEHARLSLPSSESKSQSQRFRKTAKKWKK